MCSLQRMLPVFLLITAISFPISAVATEPTMLRVETSDPYPEAMMRLQRAIEANGYRFSRVQRVDYGLRRRGYHVPPYRIVFFGKPDEMRFLSAARPDLLPFLPLKIIIYEDGDKVIIMAANPAKLGQLYRGPEVAGVFLNWRRDLHKILNDAVKVE